MALSWMKGGAEAEIERKLLSCKAWLLWVPGLLGDKSLMMLAWMKASARNGVERASRAVLLAVLTLGFLRDKSLVGVVWMRASARNEIERASRALLSAVLALGPLREKSLTVLTQVKGRASAEIERAFRRCKVWLFPAPERNPVSYTHLTLPTNREV